MPVTTRLSLLALATLFVPLVAANSNPTAAVAPTSYTVPNGVEVIWAELTGGRGGSTSYGEDVGVGGDGCAVWTPLAVGSGDSVTWLLGGDGGSTTTLSGTTGGQGGTGSRPGGDGGNLTSNDGRGLPGAGGGGAASAYLNDVEVIVAAGGGGASFVGGGSGGSGCSDPGTGTSGLGTEPNAEGGAVPETGGAGGLGTTFTNPVPNPGLAGNSAFDLPAGRGGNGGVGFFTGGGGGGGGISGGGGGAGSLAVFDFRTSGAGSGAVGLSGVTTSLVPAGFPQPVYQPPFPTLPSALAIGIVDITTDQVASGVLGSAYTANLSATFEKVVTTDQAAGSFFFNIANVEWSLATVSAALPAGLSLATTGAITGTPTVAGPVRVTFAATATIEGVLLARSVVTLDVVVSDLALLPALTPTFSTPVPTVNGFTVNVTNYDPLFTWTPSVGTGTVTAGTPSGNILPLTITGLAPGASTPVTVTTTRTHYVTGSAAVTGTALTPSNPVGPSTPVSSPTPTTPTPTTPPAPNPPATPTPAPVRIDGRVPGLSAGNVLVAEGGERAVVNVFVEENTLVLETDGFQLRLKGDCSRDACLIDTSDGGREVLTLEEAGRAIVEGIGFQPGSLVHIWLFSEPRYLGSLTVAADGTFVGAVDLVNIAVGEHTLQVNGISQTGEQRSANLGVIVYPTRAALPATGTNADYASLMAMLLLTIGATLALVARRRFPA